MITINYGAFELYQHIVYTWIIWAIKRKKCVYTHRCLTYALHFSDNRDINRLMLSFVINKCP